MSHRLLPETFMDLAPFVERWALPTEKARNRKRLASTMEEIQALYDAMVSRGASILEYFDNLERSGVAKSGLPEEGRNLLYLMFALAEVAPAVEVFKQPSVIDGFDSTRFVPDHESEDWMKMQQRAHA